MQTVVYVVSDAFAVTNRIRINTFALAARHADNARYSGVR